MSVLCFGSKTALSIFSGSIWGTKKFLNSLSRKDQAGEGPVWGYPGRIGFAPPQVPSDELGEPGRNSRVGILGSGLEVPSMSPQTPLGFRVEDDSEFEGSNSHVRGSVPCCHCLPKLAHALTGGRGSS